MVIARGDVVWVDFGQPRGSEPAKRRPSAVIQDDWLLRSAINTAIVVPLTSNLRLERFPGNVLIPGRASGLSRDSVAVVTQVGPISRECMDLEPVGRLPAHLMALVTDGVRLALGM